jgi:hypothetical protein
MGHGTTRRTPLVLLHSEAGLGYVIQLKRVVAKPASMRLWNSLTFVCIFQPIPNFRPGKAVPGAEVNSNGI